jgi:hypothetical protein
VKPLCCTLVLIGVAVALTPASAGEKGKPAKKQGKSKTVGKGNTKTVTKGLVKDRSAGKFYHITRPGERVTAQVGDRLLFGVALSAAAPVERLLVRVNGAAVAAPRLRFTADHLNFVYDPELRGFYQVELVPVFPSGRQGRAVAYYLNVTKTGVSHTKTTTVVRGAGPKFVRQRDGSMVLHRANGTTVHFHQHITRPGERVTAQVGDRLAFGVPLSAAAPVEGMVVRVNRVLVATPALAFTPNHLNFVYEPRARGVYQVELVPVFPGGRQGRPVVYDLNVP